MKVIIAGSRGMTDQAAMFAALDRIIGPRKHAIAAVLCGDARGADTIGRRWAEHHGIPVQRYPADWDSHGRSAGYRRNEVMAQNADVLVAFWDGTSPGTRQMIDCALHHGLWVRVVQNA